MTGANFQIEHAQHLAPGTSDRFGELGIVASVQVFYYNFVLYSLNTVTFREKKYTRQYSRLAWKHFIFSF